LIFRRHGETAARLGMPLLVGEWGAYGRHPGTLPAAWHVVHQFEALLCGETYWSYETDLPAAPCFPALNRPYPERVAGALVSYHCDPDNALFEATWREGEKVTAPSRIYLPAWFATAPFAPALHPEGAGFRTVDAGLGTGNVYVEIPPVGRSCTRRFVIRS
jgi:endoglycosylceramidase